MKDKEIWIEEYCSKVDGDLESSHKCSIAIGQRSSEPKEFLYTGLLRVCCSCQFNMRKKKNSYANKIFFFKEIWRIQNFQHMINYHFFMFHVILYYTLQIELFPP